LLALAANLAHHCFRGEWEQEPEPHGGSLEVIESAVETTGFCERHEQPAGSSVVLERRADGVSLILPPGAAVVVASWPLLLFSLPLYGFCFLIFCGLVANGVTAAERGESLATGVILFGAFLVAGLGILLAAIDLGRCWAVLTVKRETLWVRTVSLFSDREHSWRRKEIADIRTGPAEGERYKAQAELQIHLKCTSTICFFAGRNADDLDWVATVLRHALRLPQGEQRAGLAARTKGDRIREAKVRPTRSISFRPRKPKGE
jgi:hypothetical protein